MPGNSAHNQRKARFEQDVTSGFLMPYNHAKGTIFSVIRGGIPPEPDLICQDCRTCQQIGIEVVAAYYDKNHAKFIWEQARGRTIASYSPAGPDHTTNKRALAHALRNIKNKSTKTYKTPGRLFLLAQIYPWRLYLSDVLESVETLRLPKSHPFDEIHLCSQHEIYQLFPDREWIFPYI